jgi:stress response protein SCP2
MPFAARSSNKNSMMLTRGTRLPLKEKLETLRLFVYWKGRDVDLSSFMMTEDFEYITHISYTNLWNRDRKGDMIAVHSGDITNAPHGASEFIDINVAALQKCYPTARYVAMNVYSFSQIPFKDIEVCFAGVMEREDADSGEIFEPATVKIKSDIDGNSVNTLPLLVDLKTREVIWVDLKSDSYGFNIEMTRKGIVMASKAIATSKIPTVYDVLLANVHARGGEYVDTPVDENGLLLNDVTIFAVDQGIRPMDTDVLVADYL